MRSFNNHFIHTFNNTDNDSRLFVQNILTAITKIFLSQLDNISKAELKKLNTWTQHNNQFMEHSESGNKIFLIEIFSSKKIKT